MPFSRVLSHFRNENWVFLVLELFVLVLGIFLGLQVTNWNEERVARIELRESIDRIRLEIEHDRKALEGAKKQNMQITESLKWLLIRSSEEASTANMKQQLYHLAWGLYHVSGHRPQLPFFDAFMKSERYKDIENQEKRNYLIELRDYASSARDYAGFVRDWQRSQVDTYLIGQVPLAAIADATALSNEEVVPYLPSEIDLTAFWSSLRTRNIVFHKLSEYREMMSRSNRLKEHYENASVLD